MEEYIAMKSDKKINFKIVTEECVVYQDEIDQVSIPTQVGEITVLARHAPLVSLIKAGELRIKKGGSDGYEHILSLAGGVIEVRPNSEVIILADRAEYAEDIDVDRAEKARLRAQDMLLEKEVLSDMEYASIQAVLEKEFNRVKVGKKYRKLKAH